MLEVPQVLLATTNQGKLREMLRILDGLPIRLKTLADFPEVPIANETGVSFTENARQKALHYASVTDLLTVAEDSGFEVDALNGMPGIYSARYLHPDATYPERFAEIYRAVRASGSHDRTARFVCALAVAMKEEILFETTKTVEGQLAESPAGAKGFGYDPIFIYPPYGKTFGEVSQAAKTAVSHRGQTMHALRKYLQGT